MLDTEFDEFAGMLDAVCGLLSRGTYTPNPTNTALWFRSLIAHDLAVIRGAFDAHVKDPQRGKFVPTPADVIAQIEALSADGRPGAEEAWAMVPQSEAETVVWTKEMAEAYGVAAPLLNAGDRVAARMAFKEAYGRAVTLAKAAGRPPVWLICLGSDWEQRKRALAAAAEAGRISPELAYESCPALPAPESVAALLPAPNPPMRASARQQLQALVDSKRGTPLKPLAWAHDLKAREEAGEALTMDQRRAWRDALVWVPTGPRQEFSAGIAIPLDALPPGMRADITRERAEQGARSQA